MLSPMVKGDTFDDDPGKSNSRGMGSAQVRPIINYVMLTYSTVTNRAISKQHSNLRASLLGG